MEGYEVNPEVNERGIDRLKTVMITAFEGWNDAGAAASSAVLHLGQVWDAIPYARLDPEDFHDLQVNRPTLTRDDDGNRILSWPATTVYRAELPSGREMVLVHGIEPSMRWQRFCHDILDYADDLEVDVVVSLGSLLADVPHTRALPVSASSDDPGLREKFNLEPSTYEGPVGITTVLHHLAHDRGLESMSLWAAVPHYVAHPPSPKATLALLKKLEDVLGMPLPVGELEDDSIAWQQGVDELAADDEEIADYIQQLEETKDTADLPEASGEAIALEFERFLRRRESDGGKG